MNLMPYHRWHQNGFLLFWKLCKLSFILKKRGDHMVIYLSDILDITFKVLLKLMYVSTIYYQFNIYSTSKKITLKKNWLI